MTGHELRRLLIVPGALPEVFAFFKDPHNLARITPPWLGFQVRWASDDAVREGTRIRYRIRWMGLPLRWESRIEEYRENERFADRMLVGPYTSWYHVHRFAAVDGGVEVRDVVRYALPGGPIGVLAHRLTVRRQLEGIFDYRTRQLRQLFGQR
jgi:ligand-binding SRPBCC domain-containing protein